MRSAANPPAFAELPAIRRLRAPVARRRKLLHRRVPVASAPVPTLLRRRCQDIRPRWKASALIRTLWRRCSTNPRRVRAIRERSQGVQASAARSTPRLDASSHKTVRAMSEILLATAQVFDALAQSGSASRPGRQRSFWPAAQQAQSMMRASAAAQWASKPRHVGAGRQCAAFSRSPLQPQLLGVHGQPSRGLRRSRQPSGRVRRNPVAGSTVRLDLPETRNAFQQAAPKRR